MSNIALRKIFTMLAEKLARLEIFYETKIEIKETSSKNFVNSCQDSLKKIKQELSAIYPIIEKTYDNQPVSQEDTEEFLAVYKKCLGKFLELHSLSAHLPLNPIAAETYIFLSEVLKVKKNKDFDSRIVLLTQDFLTRNTHKCHTNLPFISDVEKNPLALYLPIIEHSNPLYWPLLVKNMFGNIEELKAVTRKHYEELIGQKVGQDEEKRKITEKLAFQLTYDLFSMKLLGPAYFYLFVEVGVFRSIAESKNRYLPTLSIREGLLYKELVRQNLAHKAEDTHKWFLTLSELSDEMHSTLGFKVDISDPMSGLDELVKRLNTEVINLVQEKSLFKCSDFCVSLAGYEKLKKGILIASSTPDELKAAYDRCQEDFCENKTNEDTEKLKEKPNTPQQIINSGWIYNEFVNDDIMHEVLKNNELDYSALINHIKRFDELLLNSVEKSRIFEILLRED